MGKKEDKEGKKGFFKKLLDKLDKKLEEKSKKTGCCGGSSADDRDSCCS